MNKFVSFCKISFFAFMLGVVGSTLSAYEIKHGYTADNGMIYYGSCENGKELMVLAAKDGSFVYEGPAAKGILQTNGNLDIAARKACGE